VGLDRGSKRSRESEALEQEGRENWLCLASENAQPMYFMERGLCPEKIIIPENSCAVRLNKPLQGAPSLSLPLR
jgi:hypothetical protein